jgi:hypothetical protein
MKALFAKRLFAGEKRDFTQFGFLGLVQARQTKRAQNAPFLFAA